ncbi:MAG: peptidoglycan-associated lipoprotein Pal [Burkholderiales bacterium]
MLVAGCASGTKLDTPAPVENKMPDANAMGSGSASGSGVGSGRVSESQVASVDTNRSATGAAADAAKRTVYFEFDSYVVKDEYRGVIDYNAKLLSADAKRRMQAEGHTDERGGTEYNLALGQRRAEAVVKALALMGGKESQVEAVSYGKERPAAEGSNEAAWAKNRRVELKDR